MIDISIDVMGGDFGSIVTLAACLKSLKKHIDLRLHLVGNELEIQNATSTAQWLPFKDRFNVIASSNDVLMHDEPANAMRHKKTSSMRLALDLVKTQVCHACVSAGNTGALVMTAKYVLKTLPNVDRPGLQAFIPTHEGKNVRMIDLGATLSLTPVQYAQFAVMTALLSYHVDGIQRPKVGLLNVGSESNKGSDTIKSADKLLIHIANTLSLFDYTGFIEGHDIFRDKVDIVLCDGYVGNISLKVSEGVIGLMSHLIKKQFNKNIITRLAGLCAMSALKGMKAEIDPDKRNGATLLGLNGIVIKSHGSANVDGFINAIDTAYSQGQVNAADIFKDTLIKLDFNEVEL